MSRDKITHILCLVRGRLDQARDRPRRCKATGLRDYCCSQKHYTFLPGETACKKQNKKKLTDLWNCLSERGKFITCVPNIFPCKQPGVLYTSCGIIPLVKWYVVALKLHENIIVGKGFFFSPILLGILGLKFTTVQRFDQRSPSRQWSNDIFVVLYNDTFLFAYFIFPSMCPRRRSAVSCYKISVNLETISHQILD